MKCCAPFLATLPVFVCLLVPATAEGRLRETVEQLTVLNHPMYRNQTVDDDDETRNRMLQSGCDVTEIAVRMSD